MSFQLMKERIKCSGNTPRNEMIIDGQNLLKEELEHDSSFCPTLYFWDSVKKCDGRPANLRIYDRNFSSLNGNYQKFLTTYDNPIKNGEYLHDTKDDTFWIVYNSFNVNDIHYEGKLIQCNYSLRWQLANGEIVERLANIVSASKYDVGESGNNKIILTTNNYTILIGYCEEGFELEGQRVFIDMNPHKPTKVFKITRSDDVIYNSGNKGFLLSFIADKTEFNPAVDNQDLRICDYKDITSSTSPLPPQPSIPNETTDLRCVISGNTNLKNGYKRTYTVIFTDKDNNSVDWQQVNYQWNVKSDFDVKQTITDNKITVSVDDENLIGGSFFVSVSGGNVMLSEIKINIIE